MSDIQLFEDHAGFSVSHDDTGAGARLYRTWTKRFCDLVISAVLLPVIAPVVAVLWALVRLDGGPAIYAQRRVGRNGTSFVCYKLRTMVVDADRVLAELIASDPAAKEEWDRYQKLADDPRITPVGRFLRRTSLDELPQILNVLKGDMSLVGPRPFTECQTEIYLSCGGRSYFDMRPGITGEWQVNGRHCTRFSTRVQFDEAYGKTISFLNDIRLLIGTVGCVLRMTGR